MWWPMGEYSYEYSCHQRVPWYLSFHFFSECLSMMHNEGMRSNKEYITDEVILWPCFKLMLWSKVVEWFAWCLMGMDSLHHCFTILGLWWYVWCVTANSDLVSPMINDHVSKFIWNFNLGHPYPIQWSTCSNFNI